MKLHFITWLLIAFIFSECEEEVPSVQKPTAQHDTLAPSIIMNGNKCDTAYLYAHYDDPGAGVYTVHQGEFRCPDFLGLPNVSNSVNTHLPGVYFIRYDAKDGAGKLLSTAIRTVHVVKNNAGFLNGNYNVTCTCIATTRGVPDPVVTINNYTASVASGSPNNFFNITMLKIGPEYITPVTFLKDKYIEVGYYSPDYHLSSSGSGTLSTAGNSFTIETKFYQYSPSITNLCKSIYTKQLIIN